MKSFYHLTYPTCIMCFTSQLRKYIASPDHVLESDEVQVREDLTMIVGPVRILDTQVKQLRGKELKTVKVLWDEAT